MSGSRGWACENYKAFAVNGFYLRDQAGDLWETIEGMELLRELLIVFGLSIRSHSLIDLHEADPCMFSAL